MNRPIHSAATEQRRVRRVHNGVELLLRHVTKDELDVLAFRSLLDSSTARLV